MRHGFLLSSCAVGAAIAAFALGVVGVATKAFPHDAAPTPALPLGWSYPFACCANYDCEAVPESSVIEGARGYEIRKTGELIPMSDKRVKDSPDGQFHWCAHRAADGRTICLFVPPRSY
ncbi:hypothetical protein [Mesorhizobium sp. M2A.F.Ca.ET.067.02.1.1]|uniref:hypothetical protein n=1 Tax=Mesorhizobium sp. M2A.F.Ca.ET.067.02.1.1 TaxID=2496749 RepID=UPI001FE0DF83|nr:hypothetical protein [Mesorhizobium sp. M2A.F.Ca.ET.067.02.1.1]